MSCCAVDGHREGGMKVAFRNEEVLTIRNIVICDGCKSEKLIRETKGVPLNFDNRMNGALGLGFTFRDEGGVFKNYCQNCK